MEGEAMRLKKCFKTVLSAVLAAAMIVTAVPADTAMAAQTVQTNEEVTESTAEVDGAAQTEESAETQAVDAATEESEAQTVETTETKETETPVEQENDEPSNDTAIDLTTGYWGPTINYDATNDTAGAITIYYYAQNFDSTVNSVKVKGAWNSSWSEKFDLTAVDGKDGMYSYTFSLDTWGRDQSYQYGFDVNPDETGNGSWDADDCNPGSGNSTVFRNPVTDASGNVKLYYYPEHGAYPTSVKVKYRTAGSSDAYTEATMSLDATWTKVYSATLSGLADGDYEYVFEVTDAEGTTTTVQDVNNANTGKFSATSYPEEDPDVKSPEIDGKTVKFHYYNPTAKEVKLMGTVTDWNNGKDMAYDSTTGYWNLEMDLAAGNYEYKFKVDSNWIQDPLNDPDGDANNNEGNCSFVVTGLEDYEVEAVKAEDVTLPATLLKYDSTGTSEATAVTYALSTETAEAEWASKITLTAEDGTTTLNVASDIPEDVTEFTLTATDADKNTAVITVKVVDVKYTYTIYYYDADHTIDNSALWIWKDGAAGTAYTFDETVELDGNTWLKKTLELSFTDLNIIPSDCPTWSWQDTTRTFSNTDKKENVELYIMYEDGANIYTELPEVKVAEKRYLVVEYTRNDGSAENWYFYTWNSGYGSNVFVPFEKVDGKWIAKVPVKQGLSSLSWCIERATVSGEEVTHWAEKDGNDYNLSLPVDQTVVKICMEEGKGVTKVYPYNDGYEIAPLEQKIHFYYRNDEAFAAGSTGGFDSVQVEIDGTAYDMTFNADEQRYTYDYTMPSLESKTYKYRYLLKNGTETKYVLDKFNTETVTENDVEYSACKYEKFEVEVSARFANASMDYNDNNVLSLTFNGKDGADVSGMEAASATADLTALGGGVTAIDPQLLALTVAVTESTATGEKTIPVTVYDQYGNEYKTETTVNVVARDKSGDFDWDEAVIYFTVTDRFFDGNTKNNGKSSAGYLKGENDSLSYHGGDFAGLTKKLDYLQDLGVNTIWITPIVENKMEAGLETDLVDTLSWGYHGYWASDFTKLDSHLGTEKEFKALLDAAHKRGMKIMVDVVLNHTGYGWEEKFNTIIKDEDGNYVPMIRTSEQMVNGDNQKSSLSNLPDFLTENEEVRELLVEWQSSWVSKYDIDYYRVDTVKHVDDTTWSAFKNALTEIDPDFKMIGEWAGAGYATDTGMLRTGRMDSLLDFDFNNQATAFVTGSIASTESFLAARNAAIDNTATLGAFLGSHDEDGFIYNLVNSEKMSEEDATALAKVAASLQITTKGQVVIYYGEEIGMTGANNYPYQTNRYDFDWSLVNDNNDMLNHYKRLLSIRKQYSEVFAKGTRTSILADDTQKLDVFARSHNGQTVYTALNLNGEAKEYTLTGLTANTYVMDLYGDNLYRTDADGKVTVTIPAVADGGTAIFVESEMENPFHVTCVAEKTYTGKAVTLADDELKVYYGATELTAGKDYKVTYKNNKKVGTATVTVQGTGNYEGKDTVTFNIVQKNIADEDVAVTYSEQMIATGKNLKPLSKVVYNGSTLKAADYKVEYFAVGEDGNAAETATNVKAAGKYKMVITGKGSFTGSVAKEITVHAKDSVTDISKLTVKIEGNKNYSVVFDGQPQTPEFAVYTKDGKEVDKANYDYKFVDNDQVGTASLIITGKTTATEDGGITGYIGTLTKTFVIKATKLSDVAEIDTTKWKDKVDFDETIGAAVQESNMLKLKAGKTDDTFAEDTAYTVSYSKNTKAGTATVIYTGVGKYTGTIKKTFKVNAIALFDKDGNAASELVDISGIGTTAEFAQKGSKVSVVVKFNGTTLVEGVDYKVTYKNNKAVTTENTKANKKPQVTITAMNGYTGKTTKTFEITAKDLADVNMSVADVAYQNKKGKFMCAPVLTDADGMKLKANKDYTVKYYLGDEELTKNDVVDAGETVKVVVEAKSANYKGSTEASYNITVQDISKAKVVVNAQVYTGKEITITSDDISTIKVGDTKLKEGKHYVILQDSYVNNINKGTASVTIKGIGNYGGTKTVTFKITGRTMAWWWNLIH